MKFEFRCETREAIMQIAEKFDLRYNDYMQDWAYEVANPMDIDNYFAYYENTEDDDVKFVLMEMIIQATEEQSEEEKFQKYSNVIKSVLTKDFNIHECTIYYWALLDDLSVIDLWKITPLMRQLWFTGKQREIPGINQEITWREFRYIQDDGNNDFSSQKGLFYKVTTFEILPLPKNGGVITENCKLRLPTGDLFYALSYKGDIVGWRNRIEDSAKQLQLLTGRIENEKIVLSDNRSFDISDCRVEFY